MIDLVLIVVFVALVVALFFLAMMEASLLHVRRSVVTADESSELIGFVQLDDLADPAGQSDGQLVAHRMRRPLFQHRSTLLAELVGRIG